MPGEQNRPNRPCRVFFCYRRNTAAIANFFYSVMIRDGNDYGNIWYSDRVDEGNFYEDIPYLIREAEWIVFFVGETFTAGLLDEEFETKEHAITARELVEIERERKRRQKEGLEPFRMLCVQIDGNWMDESCERDLRHLFKNAELKNSAPATYTKMNHFSFNTMEDDAFEAVEKHLTKCRRSVLQSPAAPVPQAEPTPPFFPAAKVRTRNEDRKAQLFGVPKQTGSGTEDKALNIPGKESSGQNNGIIWLSNGNVLFGSYRQDKNNDTKKPIEWLVLDRQSGKALLLSKYALDARAYNDAWADTTWAECTLQSWLNGQFLHDAFTAEDQRLILRQDVHTEENQLYRTNPGGVLRNTSVFLLSIQEAEKCFSSDNARRCAPTSYAAKHGCDTSNDYSTAEGASSCWWWLRSPGFNSGNAACVFSLGSVSESGFNVDNGSVGIRPALWINL